jgi:hypothetical protein
LVPGFEVVPVNVVERTIQDHRLDLRGPADARRLAQILNVDAVVVGAVTDYTPYYPPRMGLQVEWYAANPNFHPIPAGYGLPWGTAAEKEIPGPLVFEAELSLAKAQLKTQTPPYEKLAAGAAPAAAAPAESPDSSSNSNSAWQKADAPSGGKQINATTSGRNDSVRLASHESAVGTAAPDPKAQAKANLPADWPDPRGFVPPPPAAQPTSAGPSDAPVMRHTRTYNGHDGELTTALESYYYFRDDARMGGWQGYLQRSDDFTRFCCHMHIWEMLTARGGAGETRVVWRWSGIR